MGKAGCRPETGSTFPLPSHRQSVSFRGGASKMQGSPSGTGKAWQKAGDSPKRTACAAKPTNWCAKRHSQQRPSPKSRAAFRSHSTTSATAPSWWTTFELGLLSKSWKLDTKHRLALLLPFWWLRTTCWTECWLLLPHRKRAWRLSSLSSPSPKTCSCSLIWPHGRTFSYFMTFERNGSFRRSWCRWTGVFNIYNYTIALCLNVSQSFQINANLNYAFIVFCYSEIVRGAVG